MMEHGTAGAREILKTIEYMAGWEYTTPDLVTDADWNRLYETLIMDSQNTDVDEFLDKNPYQKQSALATLLELTRKTDEDGDPYWDAPEEIRENLVKEYVESVVEAQGPCCCIVCCGNSALQETVQGLISSLVTDGKLSKNTAAQYLQIMKEALQSEEEEEPEKKTSSNHPLESVKVVNSSSISGSESNRTTTSQEGGYGESVNPPDPDVLEGYEMTKEPRQPEKPDESGGMSFSASDIIGTLLVLLAVGVMYAGYRRRKV
jgi:cobaltochelatase CobN